MYRKISALPFLLLNPLPNDLKKAVIIPIYKNSKLSKENYRSKSILPNISKVNERCLFDQISKYFETIFSKFQGGFCMGHSAYTIY